MSYGQQLYARRHSRSDFGLISKNVLLAAFREGPPKNEQRWFAAFRRGLIRKFSAKVFSKSATSSDKAFDWSKLVLVIMGMSLNFACPHKPLTQISNVVPSKWSQQKTLTSYTYSSN
jgi:hypothetical protein